MSVMKKAHELKQERTAKIDAQNALVEKATAENRELNTEELAQFDTLQTEIDGLNKSVERAIQHEQNQKLAAERNADPVDPKKKPDSEEREYNSLVRKYSIHRAIRSVTENRLMDGVEKEVNDELTQRAEKIGMEVSGIVLPMASRSVQNRAAGQTVTQDSGAYGGNLVQTDLMSPIEFLRPKPVLESMGVRRLTGLTGNLKFPTNDGGVTATWEDEVAEVSNSKTAIGSKNMSSKRLSASVLISLQTLAQSAFDVEMMTIEEINAAVANAIDVAGINGSGSGQPLGILNAAGTNLVAAGTNGAAPTWNNIVDLETGTFVGNANVARMSYLINPVTRGKLKKTKHDAGDATYLMGTDNMLNGYSAYTSNLVPSNLTKGTSSGVCSAAIFGDFSQLLIGDWAYMLLTVDNLSRIKEGYVEVTTNSFHDLLVRQPKAFSVVKDWLTT